MSRPGQLLLGGGVWPGNVLNSQSSWKERERGEGERERREEIEKRRSIDEMGWLTVR